MNETFAHRTWAGSLFIAALLIIIGVWFQALVPVNRDAAFMTHSASRVLAGLPLVPHFEETAFNTAIFLALTSNDLLYAPAAALSAVTGIPRSAAIKFEALLVAAIAFLALYRFCRDGRQTWPALPLLLPTAAFVLVIFPVDMYAQREHMFLLLTLPWLVARAGEAAGMPARPLPPRIVSAMMVAGFLIKPYFLPIWAAVELQRITTARSLRPVLGGETLALALAYGVVYGGSLAAIFLLYRIPEEQLSIAALLSHRFMTHSMHDLLIRGLNVLWVITLPLPVILWRRGGAAQRGTAVWLLALLGAVVGSVAQLRGHDYNWYPAIAFATLALAWAATTSPGWRRWAVGGLLAVQVVLALVRDIGYGRSEYLMGRQLERLTPAIAELAQGGKVVFLTVNHYPVYAVLAQSGLMNGLRFQTLGFVTGIIEPDLKARLIPTLAQAVAQDINAPDVRVVVAQDGLNQIPGVADLVAQPFFQEAMAGLRLARTVDDYRLLVRK